MRCIFAGLLLGCLLVFWPAAAARGQEATAQQVLDAVNALRLGRGLAAYAVDAGLMAYAQQHSEYQASIDTSTHLHSDGSLSWTSGILENVAAGTAGYINAEVIVYEIWSDDGHMKPMVGYASGAMGAGMALAEDTAYYTLSVRPSGALAQQATATRPPGLVGTASVPTETPFIAIEALVTATPLPDGAVYHVVGYGQTLWSIALAYEVKIDEIRALNNMAADSNDIYAGQKLLIKLPGTPYAAPTTAITGTLTTSPTAVASATRIPTRTPAPPASATPVVIEQATPTPVQPSQPAGFGAWRQPLGLGLLVLAAFGLGVWLGQYLAERKAVRPDTKTVDEDTQTADAEATRDE